MATQLAQPSVTELQDALREARTRTLELVQDLTDEQMIGPRLDIVNPLRWEIAHVAWFQEFWVLRHFRREPPTWPEGDRLYDSARIAHDTRWDLLLPSKAKTLEYIARILDRIVERPAGSDSERQIDGYDEAYFMRLALLHEYMHAEAITYTRQTLGYSAPRVGIAQAGKNGGGKAAPASGGSLGDAEIPGGTFLLGSTRDQPFVFDNEQWAHPVTLRPFRMARTAVSNGEFAAFVNDSGYTRRDLWTDAGWRWRESAKVEHPLYWRCADDGWERRNFDAWGPLETRLPVLHVSWYEADAYCRWARRRLPTEAEWEMAASAERSAGHSGIAERRRLCPWGDEPPTPERANLNWRAMASVEVDALPAGDSAFGCRQMIGNVWEWTATDFGPFPGFQIDPYKEYSQPWFGTHKVLRGGAWPTQPRLLRNTWRNFYTPDRRDVWAGFRTCRALQ